MPRRPTLRTIEVFASLEGEGGRQGAPAVFVRLAGCNLRCPFCDTKYAWEEGEEETVESLLEKVVEARRRLPAKWVVLTGGEPLLQNIGPFISALHGTGSLVRVETNGTIDPRPAADWYTLSPKPPDYSFRPAFSVKAREVKLVVSKDLTFDRTAAVRRSFDPSIPLFLQPQSNSAWSMKKAVALAERACREGLDEVRVSIQLHKVLGLD